VDNRLNLGLGKTEKIDSVSHKMERWQKAGAAGVTPNQTIRFKQLEAASADAEVSLPKKEATLLSASSDDYGIDFIHKENEFVDFDRDKLIYHMLSTEGPRMARGM
jgi:hypothetical protein